MVKSQNTKMETSAEKQLTVSSNLRKSSCTESAYAPLINMVNEELETFIMAFIQILKRSDKKCGKDEVFELDNNSLEKEISWEIFESLL